MGLQPTYRDETIYLLRIITKYQQDILLVEEILHHLDVKNPANN